MTTLSISFSILLTIALLILLVPLAMKTRLGTDSTAKKALISIAVFVPVFSMVTYFSLGTPEFAEMATQQDSPPMTTLVEKLEEKLAQKPKDVDGWLLLGRSYMVTEQFQKAITAFEKAIIMEPKNLNAILPLADAIAVTQGGSLAGRPYQLLLQAYELDSNSEMALWLLGMAEKQRNDTEQAAYYWQKLLKQLPADSEDRIKIQGMLASIGIEVQTKQKPVIDAETTPLNEIEIHLTIDSQTQKALSDTTVFIYAKEPQGKPMPIAAKRVAGAELGKIIRLTNKEILLGNQSFDQFHSLLIGVKIVVNGISPEQILYKKEQITVDNAPLQFIIKL